MAGGGGLACVDLHVLSLLPRTLGSQYAAFVDPGNMSEEKELDALRCIFNSRVPQEAMDRAAEAKDKPTDPIESCDESDSMAEVINHADQVQGWRPGLSLKRAHFPLNPNAVDPLLQLDSKTNLDDIKDPEDFWAAVDKRERTQKVLKRLRGDVDKESTENLEQTPPRKQCPGILGRRANYKDYFRTQLGRIKMSSLSQCENQALSPLKSTTNDSTFIPISHPRIQSGASQAGEADKTCDPLLHVNLDDIKDPEEFWAAVDKMEYAKKVLKRLKGDVDKESTKNLEQTPPRKHLPGIPGTDYFRRRASYKDYFRTQLGRIDMSSLSQCENQSLSSLKSTTNDSTFVPISHPRIQSGASQAGVANKTSILSASELQGSMAKEEKNVDHILSDLLYSFEYVKEGEEIEFLEKRLGFKSINTNKVCLPPLDGCCGNNILITDVQTTRNVFGTSKMDSRNTTRSPLASIAELKRRVLQDLRKDPLEDPFDMESLSDSSSENSSLNEGSRRLSKTKNRPNRRSNSLASGSEIQDLMRTPTSNSLANDVASMTTADNMRDKVEGIVFDSSIANEADHPDQELNLKTSEEIMDVDNRTNGPSVDSGVLANLQVDDTLMEKSVACEVNTTDGRMVCQRASFGDITNGLSVETAALVNNEVHDALDEPASSVVQDDVKADVVSNRLETSSGEKSDDIHQEALIASEADCDDEESSIGFANTKIPVNADLLEVGDPSIDKADDLRQALLSNTEERNEESNCRSAMREERPKSIIQPSVTAPRNIPNCHIGGTEVDALNNVAPTATNLSAEDENCVINEEMLIMSEAEASANESPVDIKVNADSHEIDGAITDKVNNDPQIHASNYKGTESEPSCRSTRKKGQPESTTQPNSTAPRNIPSHQIDGIELGASNVVVPTTMDFSSEDESDNINEETLIMTEAGASPVDNSIYADSLKIGDTTRYRTDDQEAHASNYKERISGSIVQEERPESTNQPRSTSNPLTDGIERDASFVVPTAIHFSSEDENDDINDEILIMNEAGASPDEIPVDYGVDADSLEIGGAITDKVIVVEEAGMSNRNDLPSADVAMNIPVGGCSGSSSILDEHNSEEENQSNSMAALEVVTQKRQSKQKRKDRRQSLAGAGTAWQSGVRRSTRFRTKPLAHWRGERILYARIHDTLPTMIGVKYASPGKSNQKVPQSLKVKSFVSEEYADLLQKIAFH